MYSHRQLPFRCGAFFEQGVFKHEKEKGQKGRLDDVPYGLARTISSNLYCQTAAGIGLMGVEHVAVCSKCMERAMQMFCGN